MSDIEIYRQGVSKLRQAGTSRDFFQSDVGFMEKACAFRFHQSQDRAFLEEGFEAI
jgi:hypothetical protein